ncbi:hypothetical protein C475_19628 [Halosimplex carlsbadense 2-9-1]|uniref:Uncharacterized protein n=1 Tax=Halosimplex carlsbadense 2-9-1 TaxID=797114 RepID=M0CDW5_9EURY|nr:hypothetical protein C475_19628 [Halosimplex carlsbadense 2-9-1]
MDRVCDCIDESVELISSWIPFEDVAERIEVFLDFFLTRAIQIQQFLILDLLKDASLIVLGFILVSTSVEFRLYSKSRGRLDFCPHCIVTLEARIRNRVIPVTRVIQD